MRITCPFIRFAFFFFKGEYKVEGILKISKSWAMFFELVCIAKKKILLRFRERTKECAQYSCLGMNERYVSARKKFLFDCPRLLRWCGLKVKPCFLFSSLSLQVLGVLRDPGALWRTPSRVQNCQQSDGTGVKHIEFSFWFFEPGSCAVVVWRTPMPLGAVLDARAQMWWWCRVFSDHGNFSAAAIYFSPLGCLGMREHILPKKLEKIEIEVRSPRWNKTPKERRQRLIQFLVSESRENLKNPAAWYVFHFFSWCFIF